MDEWISVKDRIPPHLQIVLAYDCRRPYIAFRPVGPELMSPNLFGTPQAITHTSTKSPF